MARIDYDERWAQGKILLWLNEVIRQGKFPFEAAEQEVKIKTPKGHRRYPDIVIWYKKPDRIACIIELKQPIVDVYNDDLVHAALEKASLAGIPFFATWNLNKFVLWETFKPGTSLLDRRLHHWDVLDIKRVSELERYERTVKEFLSSFLSALAKYYEEKVVKVRELTVPKIYEIQVIPKLYPDEILVYRLKTAVDSLYIPISEYILKKKEEDPEFFSKVAEWFVKQGWIFSDSEEDYDRLARQVVYLLINKILFYNVLRSRFKLSPINVSNVKTGEDLREKLQEYFNTGIRLGYGVIFAANFLETIPIPDEAVDELKRLINELNKYDFSKIGYDVIGKVFEKLIPRTERHKLGQYFTRTDVVDLILGFTIKHPDAKILDPACGSGTFLVRAYYRKKYLARKLYKEGKYPKPDKPHKELIKELWGIDVAKFPAHLAEINLIIRNLEALENKPVIACRDFFEVEPGRKTPLYELAYKVPGLAREQIEVTFPGDFDAVVTNPPYTRQEEMEDVFMGGYKDRLRQLVKRIHGVDVGKRSSIYVYFFFHGGAFVKEGGRVGLITSNSWLDVDYGKYLQEYFLKNFKIIAIIESKVERWFEDADIITAITILEKCSNKKERDENLVKFVQLKVPLRELIPEPNVEDEEEKERLRWETIDKLVKLIEETNEYYEDDKIRIFPKKQAELWDEGYDDEKGKYVGSKWGIYLRAPTFKAIIDEKMKSGIFVKLKDIATIGRGIRTGANEFFYLTKDKVMKYKIEKEYLKPLIKSPRDLEKVVIDDDTQIKYWVLCVDEPKQRLKGKNVLKYILKGEEEGIPKKNVPKCKGLWYNLCLSSRSFNNTLLVPEVIDDRFIVFLNIIGAVPDQRFSVIKPKIDISTKALGVILNSTLTALMFELYGRTQLGQGGLDLPPSDLSKIPVLDIRKLTQDQIQKLEEMFDSIVVVDSVFKELLNIRLSDKDLLKISLDELMNSFSLDRVNKKRLELDLLILNIAGINKEHLIDIYKLLLELTFNRLKRAAIIKELKRKKKGKDIDPNTIAENIIKRVKFNKRFPEDYIIDYKGPWIEELKLPKGSNVVLGTDLGGFYVKIDEREIYRGWKSYVAKYVYYALLCGNNIIRVPENDDVIRKAVEMFEEDLKKLKEEASKLLELTVPDAKIRSEVENLVWKKILGKAK